MLLRWLLLIAFFVAGCHTLPPQSPASQRPFCFAADTFVFANELVWEYQLDPESGRMIHKRRETRPTYAQRCFAMTRLAKQFYQNTQFDPAQAKSTDSHYRQIVRRIRSSPLPKTAAEKIQIPGYANLREFSAAYEHLIKKATGGAWRSYFQRGNWRMIFPFSRRHQARTAQRLAQSLQQNRLPIVHLAAFPALTINHALLLFDAAENDAQIQFTAYDPNDPDKPVCLTFHKQKRTFHLPPNRYFAGGEVNAYEIYRGCCF